MDVIIEQWDSEGATNTTKVRVCVEKPLENTSITICNYYRFIIEGRYDSITDEMKDCVIEKINSIKE